MRIEIRISRCGTYGWWVLLSRNGQVMATSEIYANPSNARRAGKRAGKALKLPVRGPMMEIK